MQIKVLQKANSQDIDALSSIHYTELRGSLLSRFGKKFLRFLYDGICSDEGNIILVLRSGKQIVGFLIAAKNISQFYKNSIKKNLFSITCEMIFHAPGNVLLLLKMIGLLAEQKPNGIDATEIQFFAILPQFRRKGKGRKMLQMLKSLLTKESIQYLKVGTKASNKLSNRFYLQNGFRFLYKKNILGDELNYYLLKTGIKTNK